MNETQRRVLDRKRFLWVVEDPRFIETYVKEIRRAGGTVRVAIGVDRGSEIIRRGASYNIVIYTMKMRVGDLFAGDASARNGEATGHCFERWVRSPDGGNLPHDKTPLLLFTDMRSAFLTACDFGPRGPHDRTVTLPIADRGSFPVYPPDFEFVPLLAAMASHKK